ncbi:hypothetical protein ACFST9_07610 [Hymenobacter monticola]|uniref:Uncharacterized protein n=1 Tax=Hymenobacter monticola TaxID=1705399 RepID=A0ABY4B3L0_9BACT|nr:hypothetical protein [Hymenobacter monticola]UOE33726.1 hypothetical protein MTP16_21710 [Hymenobacter monticola]
MATPTPAVEGRTTLYHRRHAKQQVGKSLGHVAPALVLFFGVVPILTGAEHFTLLGALEIAVGAAYLVLMVREMRHLRHNPFHREPMARPTRWCTALMAKSTASRLPTRTMAPRTATVCWRTPPGIWPLRQRQTKRLSQQLRLAIWGFTGNLCPALNLPNAPSQTRCFWPLRLVA